MGLLGILLGLGLLVGLSFRGWSVLLLAPAAALIAAAFAGEPLLAHWTQTFMESAGRFIAQFFPLFLLGALFGKLMCKLTGGKINPLIGAAGISAYPMAARVVQTEGLRYDKKNHLLMHAAGANTGGEGRTVTMSAEANVDIVVSGLAGAETGVITFTWTAIAGITGSAAVTFTGTTNTTATVSLPPNTTIAIGRVIDLIAKGSGEPLLFFRGQYRE